MDHLSSERCLPCEGGQPPLTSVEIKEYLLQLSEWTIDKAQTTITRQFKFKDFKKTIFFINAIAWISDQEGHHPEITAGYNYCIIHFTTHAIKGLSKNDFICAAKIDALLS